MLLLPVAEQPTFGCEGLVAALDRYYLVSECFNVSVNTFYADFSNTFLKVFSYRVPNK